METQWNETDSYWGFCILITTMNLICMLSVIYVWVWKHSDHMTNSNSPCTLSCKWMKKFKVIAFWDIALCILIEVDWHFRGVYCLYREGDDEDSTYLWNVILLQWDYIALYPWRLSSSYFLLCEPEISQWKNCFVTFWTLQFWTVLFSSHLMVQSYHINISDLPWSGT
jgi:hypothetical protein